MGTIPKIEIVVSTRCIRQWIIILRDELLLLGLDVEIFALTDNTEAQESRLERFERFSRRFGSGINSPTTRLSNSTIYPASILNIETVSLTDNILLDLTYSNKLRAERARVLRPLFNGSSSEQAMLTGIWRRSPVLEIELGKDGERQIIHKAVVAIPNREVIVNALDSCFGQLVSLCLDSVLNLWTNKPLPPFSEPDPGEGLEEKQEAWIQVRRGYIPKLTRQIAKPFVYKDDWAIAVRQRLTPAQDDLPIGPTRLDMFNVLPCPSHRFYADPMLFEAGTDTFLFFEDYDIQARRAAISYARVDQSGVGPVHRALERPYHLSYPFVFQHNNKIFMIPETSENTAVELYEAVQFPDRWELRSSLLPLRGCDATLHWDESSELWWMFASVSKFGSMWDTLSLFYSKTIDGPWQPHSANPVKYDCRSSRPAGPLLQVGTNLFRPTQDCSSGYGDSIVWCEILELNPQCYRERVVGRQTLSDARYKGPHTFTRSRLYEAVDLKRNRVKVPRIFSRA